MICIFLSLLFHFTIPIEERDELVAKLEQISTAPEQITISNNLKIVRKGGHLQGIQAYQHHDQTFLYMSGSSTEYGYLAAATMKQVEKLHILRNKPLKHAGGFQIHKDWLAVGIEDNELRNTSEVHVYQLGDPHAGELKIRAVVARNGAWERATAGAVAIMEWQGKLLMLVGDWSNRHIDFYQAPLDLGEEMLEFQKTSEIEMATYDKTKWVDPIPWPYQNINLIKYNEMLLLFGFSSGTNDENLMDVYTLESAGSDAPILTKIYTKSFPKTSLTRFGWGAGVGFDDENFTLYACGENIRKQVVITRYSSN